MLKGSGRPLGSESGEGGGQAGDPGGLRTPPPACMPAGGTAKRSSLGMKAAEQPHSEGMDGRWSGGVTTASNLLSEPAGLGPASDGRGGACPRAGGGGAGMRAGGREAFRGGPGR